MTDNKWSALATQAAETLVDTTMFGVGVELTEGARKVLINMVRVAFLQGAEAAAMDAFDTVAASMQEVSADGEKV